MQQDERIFASMRRVRRSPLWGLFWAAGFVLACAETLRNSGFERALDAALALVFLLEALGAAQRWRDTRRGA